MPGLPNNLDFTGQLVNHSIWKISSSIGFLKGDEKYELFIYYHNYHYLNRVRTVIVHQSFSLSPFLSHRQGRYSRHQKRGVRPVGRYVYPRVQLSAYRARGMKPGLLHVWIPYGAGDCYGKPFSGRLLMMRRTTMTNPMFRVSIYTITNVVVVIIGLSVAAPVRAQTEPADCERSFTPQRIITTNADGARSVYAADLDGDGDTDVLSASRFDGKIAWYENTDGFGKFGIQQIITRAAGGAHSVFASDLDGDGDIDVLSASSVDDKIAWYENTNGMGSFGPQRIITTSANGAASVFATDIDGDGDNDVLSASFIDGKIAWYENIDGRGTFGSQQIITNTATDALSVFASDLDGDGDSDVLSASSHKIMWYENIDGLGTFGFPQVITVAADGAFFVFAADIDGDGDSDVLSASIRDNKIAWYENINGLATFGPQLIIATPVNALSVFAADLDGDGDTDVLSASIYGAVAWYENIDGLGSFGQQQIITYEINDLYSVIATDLDGDGDSDVISASSGDDKIAWYENESDCNDNGINDGCDLASGFSMDCNGNGRLDECEIAKGTSANCNGNSVPDECESGCNSNHQPDKCDIADGTSADCNDNGVPDECDLTDNTSDDCNGNGVPDECEPECNGNGFPDDCDIDSGTSADCNANGIPDECDLTDVTSDDCNGNGVPDECDVEPVFLGKIITSTVRGSDIYVTDLDGDGDFDVLIASSHKIMWYENIDGLGTFGPQQVITIEVEYVTSIFAIDLDGDGDTDVLSASENDDKIAWYENIDGQGKFGEQKLISTVADGTTFVFAEDLDGDGDTDVLSWSSFDDKIVWYENINGLGNFSPQKIITNSANSATSVIVADLDGDGDSDILVASHVDRKIKWYENIDARGTFGVQHEITNSTLGTVSVFAIDLDRDGDLDVLSSFSRAGKIAWYENTDGLGTFGPQLIITTARNGAFSVLVADMDGDGDTDVLSASFRDDKIVWYENTDSLGTFSPQRIITAVDSGVSIFLVADLDSDGDTDILASTASFLDRSIAWYKNVPFSRDCNDNDVPDECDLIRTGDGGGRDCFDNIVPIECISDGDGDRIHDDCDLCLDSLIDETLTVSGCETGVENVTFVGGCTMADLIADCEDASGNYGNLASCVTGLTRLWRNDHIISGREQGLILSCAAKSNTGRQSSNQSSLDTAKKH